MTPKWAEGLIGTAKINQSILAFYKAIGLTFKQNL